MSEVRNKVESLEGKLEKVLSSEIIAFKIWEAAGNLTQEREEIDANVKAVLVRCVELAATIVFESEGCEVNIESPDWEKDLVSDLNLLVWEGVFEKEQIPELAELLYQCPANLEKNREIDTFLLLALRGVAHAATLVAAMMKNGLSLSLLGYEGEEKSSDGSKQNFSQMDLSRLVIQEEGEDLKAVLKRVLEVAGVDLDDDEPSDDGDSSIVWN